MILSSSTIKIKHIYPNFSQFGYIILHGQTLSLSPSFLGKIKEGDQKATHAHSGCIIPSSSQSLETGT